MRITALRSLRQELVGVEERPALVGLHVAVGLQDIQRALPVGLRTEADATLGVLRLEQRQVGAELVLERLAVEIGLGLHRRIDRGVGILARFFPRARARLDEAPHEVRLALADAVLREYGEADQADAA